MLQALELGSNERIVVNESSGSSVHRAQSIKLIFGRTIPQPERAQPSHMLTCNGPVKSRNLKKSASASNLINMNCLLCSKYIKESISKLCCLNPKCELICHITCLADLFLMPGEYIPIEGCCPFCKMKLKWGDLIRKMKGCQEFCKDGNDVEDKYDKEESGGSSDDEVIYSQDRGFVDNNSHWLLDNNDELK